MTFSQAAYVIAVGIYAVFFLLFARFFVWKRYADRQYWLRRPVLDLEAEQRRAAAGGLELPRFAIVVPARDEADVIARTVDHMRAMAYPKDRYELIIATDAKEPLERDLLRDRLIPPAQAFLAGRTPGETPPAEAGKLVLGLLTELACQEWVTAPKVAGTVSLQSLRLLKCSEREELLADVAALLASSRGRAPASRILRLLRRAFPGRPDSFITSLYPACLGLALPVVSAYLRLKGNGHRALAALITHAAHAHHGLTRAILLSLTEAVSDGALRKVQTLTASGRLRPSLERTFQRRFPTTAEIVEGKAAELSEGPDSALALKHVVVPIDFDGAFPGRLTGKPVPSTKGRALNWALRFVDRRTAMCGFFDAESRPHREVMLYVARRRLEDGERVPILQGPVFQVRNFYDMGPFCKIASLYQALAHDWYLPALFRRLPFVGGTNLFVDKQLLQELGGYDAHALTEDLELGTRAYLARGAWPEYLPYPSSEQTPPSFRAFFRQRLRWGTGHLQVMDKIRSGRSLPVERRRILLRWLFWKGQMEWLMYQAATFVPPAVIILWLTGNLDPNVLPEAVRWVLNGLSLVYFGFTLYAFRRYSAYMDDGARPRGLFGRAGVVSGLALLPLAAFFFPVPYSSAYVLKTVNRHPRHWVKTPRTRE